MEETNALRVAQLNQFMELYYQPLFRFAVRLCDSPVRAMLITQRTFRVAFERSADLPLPNNRRAWLFTLLFHSFLEYQPASVRA